MGLEEQAVDRVAGVGNSKECVRVSLTERISINQELGVHGRCWLKVEGLLGRKR